MEKGQDCGMGDGPSSGATDRDASGGALRLLRREDLADLMRLKESAGWNQTAQDWERLLELEFDAAHFSIPWTDVTAEEVRGLQVLKEERDRYQREQAQKPPNAFPN